MRYFVTFKSNSSLALKVMVFENMTKQEVHDAMVREYPHAFESVYDEPTMARILPTTKACKNNKVKYGAPCTIKLTPVDKQNYSNIQTTLHYPLSANIDEAKIQDQ